jgi:hypothetical protein
VRIGPAPGGEQVSVSANECAEFAEFAAGRVVQHHEHPATAAEQQIVELKGLHEVEGALWQAISSAATCRSQHQIASLDKLGVEAGYVAAEVGKCTGADHREDRQK